MYIDQLDNIANKYKRTYHNTNKMKPADVKVNTWFNFSKEINDQNMKFKIGDMVRILKHKNIFAKGYVRNWPKEVFMIKQVKNTVLWTYNIKDLKRPEILGRFYKKHWKN